MQFRIIIFFFNVLEFLRLRNVKQSVLIVRRGIGLHCDVMAS